jgi:hypothetical protein
MLMFILLSDNGALRKWVAVTMLRRNALPSSSGHIKDYIKTEEHGYSEKLETAHFQTHRHFKIWSI